MVAQLKLGRLARGREATPEQRASPRRNVSLAAKVVIGAAAADCTINDISASGAKLHAPSVLRLPEEVRLVILSEGILVHAQRIWARFPLCGLKFISVEEIQRSKHPDAGPLRQAWEAWRGQQQTRRDSSEV